MGTDRQTHRQIDTEANTIVRPLYLFITVIIIKEGQTKKMRKRKLKFNRYRGAIYLLTYPMV
jgi:hypothetical protein